MSGEARNRKQKSIPQAHPSLVNEPTDKVLADAPPFDTGQIQVASHNADSMTSSSKGDDSDKTKMNSSHSSEHQTSTVESPATTVVENTSSQNSSEPATSQPQVYLGQDATFLSTMSLQERAENSALDQSDLSILAGNLDQPANQQPPLSTTPVEFPTVPMEILDTPRKRAVARSSSPPLASKRNCRSPDNTQKY